MSRIVFFTTRTKRFLGLRVFAVERVYAFAHDGLGTLSQLGQ